MAKSMHGKEPEGPTQGDASKLLVLCTSCVHPALWQMECPGLSLVTVKESNSGLQIYLGHGKSFKLDGCSACMLLWRVGPSQRFSQMP